MAKATTETMSLQVEDAVSGLKATVTIEYPANNAIFGLRALQECAGDGYIPGLLATLRKEGDQSVLEWLNDRGLDPEEG